MNSNERTHGKSTKKLVIIFTILIIVFSLFASIIGVQNYRTLNFTEFTTASGQQTEILSDGIYRYNTKVWVLGGMPWDITRLLIGIPLLLISLIFYIKNSLRGTMIFIGMVFSFFYQYLLWAIGWHFNTLFLIYTLTYGLSLTILFLVVSSISRERIKYSIKKNFPVKGTAVFLFFISAMLFLKCLGEIAPTIPDGELKEPFIGYYNLFDQSLDIGIMIPFGVYIGILLLKRNEYGYLLSLVSLLLFLNLAISIITGEVILGYMTGTLISRMMGVLFFSLFLIIDILILVKVLSAIDDMKDAGSKRAFFSGF